MFLSEILGVSTISVNFFAIRKHGKQHFGVKMLRDKILTKGKSLVMESNKTGKPK